MNFERYSHIKHTVISAFMLLLCSVFFFPQGSAFAGQNEPASSRKNEQATSLLRKPEFTIKTEPAAEEPKTGNLALDLTRSRHLLVNSIADTLPATPEQKFQTEFKQRSPVVAAVFSAVLPGAGEFYAESYLRSAAFFAIELIEWAVYIKKLDDGNSAEQKYVNFANATGTNGYRNWDARRYAKGLSQIYSGDSDPAVRNLAQYIATDASLDRIGRGDYSQLNEFERLAKFENGATFSHTLPAYGSQQYYELIGKYENYTIGWYDYPDNKLSSAFDYKTQTFLSYADQRGHANDLLNEASTVLILIVVNHALSVADAILATSEYNSRFKTHIEVQRSPATGELMPRATVQIRF